MEAKKYWACINPFMNDEVVAIFNDKILADHYAAGLATLKVIEFKDVSPDLITHYLLQIQTLKQENDKFMICINESIETCEKIISYTEGRLSKINEGINPLTKEQWKIKEFCMETIMVSAMKDKLESVTNVGNKPLMDWGTLRNKILDIINEFGDDPKATLQIIVEVLG